MKSKIIIGVLVALAVFIGLGVLGSYMPQIDQYLAGKRAERLIRANEERRATREAALRADTAGGETPEETIRLVIVALERGDVEEVVSYYHIDSREDAARQFREEMDENGNYNASVTYFKDVLEKGEKVCTLETLTCYISFVYKTKEDQELKIENYDGLVFVPKGTEQEKGISLKKNEFTQVWKIRD